MKITTIEMRGLLTGKCVPRDIKVNEDLAQYFVRKFEEHAAELARLNADAALAEKSLKEANDVVLKAHEKFNAQNEEIDALREQVRALVAASLQEINDDMALEFHRATTDGDIGGDDIEEIKNGLRAAIANIFANTPTDAILREVGARAVESLKKHPAIGLLALGSELDKHAARIRAGEKP